MSTAVSLQSCLGGIEAVLHDGKKQTCQIKNETMPVFRKTKSIHRRDIDQYPLLEYQWQEIDNIGTNRTKYDVSSWLENFRCGDGRTREILGRFREKCVSSSRRENSSSHSASKEVASAWVKMSKSSEIEVRPLRNSTRCNVIGIEERNNVAHYSRALPNNNPGTSSHTSIFPGTAPIPMSLPLKKNGTGTGTGSITGSGSTSNCRVNTTSSSTTPTARTSTDHPYVTEKPNGNCSQRARHKQSQQESFTRRRVRESIFPPPPPSISYHRRFRVCYGIMSEWRAAVDEKSGRTYYFNKKTRATQWRKPIELATDAEREEMERKERTQKAFFSAMEANILKSMETGKVVEESPKPKESNKMPEPLEKPQMVRTISTMDELILTNLVKNVATTESVYLRASQGVNTMTKIAEDSMSTECEHSLSDSMSEFFMKSSDDGFGMSDEDINALRDLSEITKEMATSNDGSFGTPSKTGLLDEEDNEEDLRSGLKDRPRPISEDSLSAFIEEDEEVEPEEDLRSGLKEKPKLIKKSNSKPKLQKRNTCGTIYLKTTMSAPDKDATIKCVCGVFRTHIISALHNGEVYNSQQDPYKIFSDRDSHRKSIAVPRGDLTLADLKLDDDVPSLDEIANFYRDVFFRAQMETDCIIMSLIYVERLIKVTGGKLRPRPSNWRSLFFACLILSSKVWDDLSMWNADFSQTCPAGVNFSLQRINELELAVLNALNFTVKVPASEYAKYYFLLRSMLITSGLGGDDIRVMNPLDVTAAQKLEQVSTSYQTVANTKRRQSMEKNFRSKSMGAAEKELLLPNTGTGRKLNLEQLVNMGKGPS